MRSQSLNKFESGDVVVASDLVHKQPAHIFSRFKFPLTVVKQVGYLVELETGDKDYKSLNEVWLKKV